MHEKKIYVSDGRRQYLGACLVQCQSQTQRIAHHLLTQALEIESAASHVPQRARNKSH